MPEEERGHKLALSTMESASYSYHMCKCLVKNTQESAFHVQMPEEEQGHEQLGRAHALRLRSVQVPGQALKRAFSMCRCRRRSGGTSSWGGRRR